MGEVTSSDEDVLVFQLDHRRFAVPASAVEEVVRAVWVEALPGAPAVVEGLVDYRGTPLAVFDMRARFGLPLRPIRVQDHLVVVKTPSRRVALRVDRVEALVKVSRQSVPVQSDRPAFAGVARLEDALLLIHDPERFLSAAEAEQLDATLRARGLDDA